MVCQASHQGSRLATAQLAAAHQFTGRQPTGAPGAVNRQSGLGHGHRCGRGKAQACREGSREQQQLSQGCKGELNPQLGTTEQGILAGDTGQ